jgi:hypothetical protein
LRLEQKMKIESLDVLKAERDLLEQTRLDDTYERLTTIIKQVTDLGVFPSLVWVWSWDVALSTLQDFEVDEEYKVNKTERELFELFWDQADQNGWSLEYGTEDLHDAIRDWMIEQNIVTSLDEEEEDE